MFRDDSRRGEKEAIPGRMPRIVAKKGISGARAPQKARTAPCKGSGVSKKTPLRASFALMTYIFTNVKININKQVKSNKNQ